MENNFVFNGYGNQEFISLDEIQRLQTNGAQPQKNMNSKRKMFKFDKDDLVKFPVTGEEVSLLSTGELADLVVDKVADVFGHDVKGIADEVLQMNGIQVPCFRLVFGKSNVHDEGCVHAVKDVNGEKGSFVDQYNMIYNAMHKGVAQNKTIELTSEAYDFLTGTLFNDNECFNDTTNDKFEAKYITYDSSRVNRAPQISVHAISLEKACEFVFGPAEYRVEIGAASREYGRLIRIFRLTKDKVKAAAYKYVGVRANEENLRTPKFNI